jgi:hypothetical protein
VEYANPVSSDSNNITSFILGIGTLCTVVVLYLSDVPEVPEDPDTPDVPDVPLSADPVWLLLPIFNKLPNPS